MRSVIEKGAHRPLSLRGLLAVGVAGPLVTLALATGAAAMVPSSAAAVRDSAKSGLRSIALYKWVLGPKHKPQAGTAYVGQLPFSYNLRAHYLLGTNYSKALARIVRAPRVGGLLSS
jgi:hypothetical protein